MRACNENPLEQSGEITRTPADVDRLGHGLDEAREDLRDAIRCVLVRCRCTALTDTTDAVEALVKTDPPVTIAEAVRQLRDREPWLFDGELKPVMGKPLTMACDPESWQWAEVRASRDRRTQRINDALAVGVGALLGLVLIGALYLVTLLF